MQDYFLVSDFRLLKKEVSTYFYNAIACEIQKILKAHSWNWGNFGQLKALSGLDKFTSTRPIFRARNFTCAPEQTRRKMGAQNQSQYACLIEKHLGMLIFVLCCLNKTSFSLHFHCNSIKSFCNEALAVWMLFECLK